MWGLISVLYVDVEGLTLLLNGYRIFWVLDFINETATDLLNDHSEILTEREKLVCRKLANNKFPKAMKSITADIPTLKRKTAMVLYETFKICRKLSLEDKIIVVENFNLNRIGK